MSDLPVKSSWATVEYIFKDSLVESQAIKDLGPLDLQSFSAEEERSIFTLWAMSKSPLILTGDLSNLREATLNIIQDPFLIGIN
jgi:hypothetical protein